MTLCRCDHPDAPVLAPIAPGLIKLPRQIGRFGHFRADLLARIRRHPALADWRARDAEDFGLMLLDFWAYVSDVTAFYTAELSQDLYLQTARGDAALRHIVALIDHIPRPAIASEAILAALLDGTDVVTAPAGAGFLSDAIDDTPPQQFELSETTALDPLRNGWTLLPPRDTLFRRDALLIDPASRNMAEGGMIVIDAGATWRKATLVKALTSETALDGGTYLRLDVADQTALPTGAFDVAAIRLWSFTQSAPVFAISGTTLTLTGHYPQLREGDLVVVEDTGLESPHAPEVGAVGSVTLGYGASATSGSGTSAVTVPGPPITTLTLSWSSAITAARARLHSGRTRAGQLAAPFKPFVTGNDLLVPRPLKLPATPPKLSGTGEVLVKGVADAGLRVPGEMQIDPATGRGKLLAGASFAGGDLAMQAPIVAHGNVLHVTRGKSVEEVLGSGQGPAVSFQTFTLTKFPLTYLRDSSAKGGRRSTLRLWIDGIEWREVTSIFTAGPDDRVFTVRLDAAGKATITTGGGGFGRAAPLGVRNVYALYRFGSGEPAPGPNHIRQVAGPVAGLRRVFNVTSAFGGAPGDQPEDIRFNAPATSAAFDRAISAADFAALACDWGVLAASAVTEWVPRAMREGIVVTAIFAADAAPEDLIELQAHLAARAAEATPIRIVAAIPVTGTLRLAYQVADDADPKAVKAALDSVFSHPFTGLLAPRRAEVGGPVFRSRIVGMAALPGVAHILSLDWNGATMPVRLSLPAHGYFAPSLVLEAVAP
ncbi:hypothetical protein [Sphingomonas sp.]|uniref:hypothetical protein n=1 Tax=Sphingomonas sp. TaxID=28214 RepID=UPI003D6C8D82